MAKKSTPTRIINGKKYFYKKVVVGQDPLTLKPKRKDFYGLTVTELNEKIDKHLSLLNKCLLSNNKETFGSLLNYWLLNVKFIQGLSESTIERYWGVFNNYILNIDTFLNLSSVSDIDSRKLLIRDIPLINLNVTHIQEYYNTLYSIGVSTNTIAFINKLIKPFISYAAVSEKITRDFTKVLHIPKDNKDFINMNDEYNDNKIVFFTPSEQKLFLKAIAGNRDELLYKLALSTGLRLGEILGLKWSCINLEDHTLKVKYSARRIKNIKTNQSELKLTALKNKSSYATIPLPEQLIPYFIQHKEKQDKEKELANDKYEDMALVFCTELGKIIEPSNLRKRYKRILKLNNINDKPFHALRHTCASRLFEIGNDIVHVKELLRHKNISTTVDIYTHFTKEYKKNLINNFPL
ncbi:tyrosine-type recombinase/integrase [Clostridium nigeriense]|uniref:tyrosine-type recombinase/integrase n=1 Tax=Clostridium nigeriense TaxID=1805470 RepID=UPI000830DD15|nr:site-specific integrase [Clostridium nigeriense]